MYEYPPCIHEELTCKNFAILGMMAHRMLINTVPDLLGQVRHDLGLCRIAQRHELGSTLELDGDHGVTRNEEGKDSGIVRGPEQDLDHACPIDRIALAVQELCLSGTVGPVCVGVVDRARMTRDRVESGFLHVLQRLNHIVHRSHPVVRACKRVIARGFPVLRRQAQKRGE